MLEGILSNQFALIFEGGRWVISTSEAGGATQFAEASGIKAGDITRLVGQALDWLDAQGTETPAGLPTVRRRYRACFGRALL